MTDFQSTVDNMIQAVRWNVFQKEEQYYLSIQLKKFNLTIKCCQNPNFKTSKDVIHDLLFNYHQRYNHTKILDYCSEYLEHFDDGIQLLNSWQQMEKIYFFMIDYCEYYDIDCENEKFVDYCMNM